MGLNPEAWVVVQSPVILGIDASSGDWGWILDLAGFRIGQEEGAIRNRVGVFDVSVGAVQELVAAHAADIRHLGDGMRRKSLGYAEAPGVSVRYPVVAQLVGLDTRGAVLIQAFAEPAISWWLFRQRSY